MEDATTTVAAQALAATISSITLALFGLTYLSLLWSLIGALASMVFTRPEERSATLITVIVSWFLGAALGTAASKFIGGGDPSLIAASAVFGAGCKPLLSQGISSIATYMRRKGDGQ